MIRNENIIFIDGYCVLCNSLSYFLSNRKARVDFEFKNLQDTESKSFLDKHGIDNTNLNTVVYYKSGSIYTKSDAVLQIIKELDGWWRFFYVFIIVPKPLRDVLYSMIVKFRYSIWGKSNSCKIKNTV